jgi:hypothetical protein
MSHSLDTPTGSGDPSTTDVAKDQARAVGQSGAEAGKQVAGTAADQAKEVAGEARRQASDLLSQGREHATEQARGGQQKAAGSLSALAEELRTLTDGEGASGPATDLLRQATGRVESFADHLRDREPADLLEDVRSFARRRPGAFLLGAAVAGVLAGRLTGGVVAAHKDDGPGTSSTPTPTPPPPAAPHDVTTGTGQLPGAPGAAVGYAAVPPVADGPGYDPVTGYSPVPPAPSAPAAPPVPPAPYGTAGGGQA